ncbi:diacylglycerol/lipid kinase family protein [Fibrella forsythiae]|uniref:Diacylglycerol kinase n=1 Tax=Fibrella forsythiae TaxID=2817061 RepID=A0ABS3JHX6_9BACT|nr:diacylglycerol kinase family protein [Fibrella forsythiae]MBO0949602.1 diacylglycerol kinase [Fibrella forsythiae]
MPNIDLLVIINPLSGTLPLAQREGLRAFIAAEANRQAYHAEIVTTTRAGQATELATQAVQRGIRRVLVMGGDGTINETARALRQTATALGIVPMGSGNGLARHLGLPMNPQKAAERALAGKPVLIDSGELNDHPFFCTAGLGFEAYVAHEFAKQPTRGLQTYIKTAYRSFWSYKPAEYLVDGKETGPLFSLTAANAAQFGNNAWIAPNANIADGKLDLCQLKPFPAHMASVIGWQLFRKSLNRSAYWSGQRMQNATIQSNAPLLAHADGEPLTLAGDTCTVRVLPGSLLVLM